MKICILGKYPPIQGGVSRQTYLTSHELARRGHSVYVVTNASEVEYGFRQMLMPDDDLLLERDYGHGFVRVINQAPLSQYSHIPMSPAYATRLLGSAITLMQEHECDVIVGWYLEPYGVIAAQVAEIFKKPLVLRHAGSDIGRLANFPEMRAAFGWALGRADRIITAPITKSLLLSLGALETALDYPKQSALPTYFGSGPQLSLEEVKGFAKQWYEQSPYPTIVKTVLAGSLATGYDRDVTTIGMYGKVHETKGSYDLIKALSGLVDRGVKFNLLVIAGGSPYSLEKYCQSINESSLRTRTTILPFLAPWKVPEFLRLCDIACFLERDFPITFHGPGVPKEVMLTGAALVCSDEIARKQYFASSLVDRKNYLRVSDPRNIGELASVLEWGLANRSDLTTIASQGKVLVTALNNQIAGSYTLTEAIESVVK